MTPDPPHRLLKITVLLTFAMLWVMLPGLTGHGEDKQYWIAWATHIKVHGLRQAYGSGTDYPPLYQYILWLYGKLCDGPDGVVRNIHRVRLIVQAFDVAGLWLVARWIGRRDWWPALVLIGFANIGASYNTLVWGQVDGILATLVFAALFAAWRGRAAAAGILMALALCFKVQAVVFVPVWGLLVVGNAAAERRWMRIAGSIAILLLTVALVAAPFLVTPSSRSALHAAIFGAVDRYPYCSMIGANVWYWIITTNPRWTQDSTQLVDGISCKHLGLLMFFAGSVLALWPLARGVLRALLRPTGKGLIAPQKLWLSAALVALLFFFCNTQMHARYSHPALLFITAYAFYARDYLPYFLFSVAYFLNLEKSFQWAFVHYEWLVFDGRFIAALFALLILYLFARLYGWRDVNGKPKKNWQSHLHSSA